MLKGRIIKNISNLYVVKVGNDLYECTPRGKFRNLKLTPMVGDIVEFDEKKLYLINILPRTNSLTRPSISNIDIALIITSLKQPDLSFNLLDKQISNIILEHIEPVICFTKLDLLSKEELKEFHKIKTYYESIKIKVFTNDNLKPLLKYLKNKYVVLTGQTGAGKSSLINKLDNTKNLETNNISEALGRGKHTTRHTEYYLIKDIYIADTPGFSALDLKNYTKEDIKKTFTEFNNYTCKYRDCNHLKEDGCNIIKAVKNNEILSSRYDNYCSFIGGIK